MGRKNWGDAIGAKLMIGLNSLFILAGIVVLIFAIISFNELENIRDNADMLKVLNLDVLLQVVFCVVGILFFSAVLGFVAAIKRIKNLMIVYILLILVVLTVEIAMAILMFSLGTNEVQETFQEDSYAGMARRDDFQRFMKCCGWWYNTEEFFPERVACVTKYPYTQTCSVAVQSILDDWVRPTAIVLITLASVCTLSLIATFVVIFSQRKKTENFFENPFSF